MALQVKLKHDKDFDSLDWRILEGEDAVFWSSSYPQAQEGSFASVFWHPDIEISIPELGRAFLDFYKQVKERGLDGVYEEKQWLGYNYILSGESEWTEVHAGQTSESTALQRLQTAFCALRFNTPYCDFGFDPIHPIMHSEIPWNTRDGKIFVITHEDLSVPLDILIQKTARHKPSSSLQPVLAELYSFKNPEEVMAYF